MDLTSGVLVDFEGGEIPASVIRDLMVKADELDPRGLRVRNARIEGQLDLCDVSAKRPLVLLDCTTDAPVLLDRAQLSALDLTGLVAPAVSAPWTRLEHYLYLGGARLDGGAENHALDLAEASVGGHVSLRGAEFRSETEYAVHAPRLRTGSELYLTDVRATGTVRFDGAHIGGNLDCEGSVLRADGRALLAVDMQVDGSLLLSHGFRASTKTSTAVRIRGTRVSGQLVLRDGRASGPTALDAKQVRVGMELLFPMEFADGEVELDGLTYASLPRDADLDGWLDLLAHKSPHYTTQPYAQLAAAH